MKYELKERLEDSLHMQIQTQKKSYLYVILENNEYRGKSDRLLYSYTSNFLHQDQLRNVLWGIRMHNKE